MILKLKHALVSMVMASSSLTFGASVTKLTYGWGEAVWLFQLFFVAAAALVGLGMMASGAIQLKKHGENPQQVPLNKALIFLASGALLFGLAATSDTLLDTIFGEGTDGTTDVTTNQFGSF